MITVNIDGAQVPINMIKRWELMENRHYYGGDTITLKVDYRTKKSSHEVLITDNKYAIEVCNNILDATEKQQELEKLEGVMGHLKYELAELDKVKEEKVAAYVSLSNARDKLLYS